ncbi:glycosyltransferase [Bacillus sp. T3]|uniref:glycosyltransferase n=1 Tax=Bacillus sp. T3 TaxID=467262 RepID=UPI002981226A|nr:glycosyltransferase [Bacillus sp. T3]
MNVGGTEKALLNMISVMSKVKYDIEILMLEKYGGFLNTIPKSVSVRYLDEYKEIKSIINEPPINVVLRYVKQGKLLNAFVLFILFLISMINKERTLLFKYVLRKFPVNGDYDLAVAYAGPMDFISYFVANKINSKKKIQWIHFDVTKIGFNKYFASKIYKMFDRIYVVSKEGKNKLDRLLPTLKDKTEVFLNIIVQENIKKLADEGLGFQDNFDGIRILTVGRLSKEKGQDLTIPVLAKLKQEGLNIRWYCIGEGNERVEYEKAIKKYEVKEDFILLGSNPNPYPFMKQCDIYIQPSRHEGYCITLAEAKCFCNPIISTNFTWCN